MTKVYSKCYDEIGAFNDTRYIVGMLEKVSITLLCCINANLICLNLSCPQFLFSLVTHRILKGEIVGLSNF